MVGYLLGILATGFPNYCLSVPTQHSVVICWFVFFSHKAVSSLKATLFPILFITKFLAPRHDLEPCELLLSAFNTATEAETANREKYGDKRENRHTNLRSIPTSYQLLVVVLC